MKLSNEYLMSRKGLELLGKLFHSSGEGIMFFNEKAEIEMMNPRSVEMFGYPEAELLGKPVEILVPDSARGKHKHHRDDYIKTPAPRQMGVGRDLSGVRKDGSSFPLELSLNFLKHEDQTLIVAFITDITIRKKNEKTVTDQKQKLEAYNAELEQMVKARTSELERTNLGLQSQIQERRLAEKALKESLRDLQKAEQEILTSLEKEKELGELKSRFVSMASHEFRTPLTTILSSANLITKYPENDQQPSREKHADRIRSSVQNLTTILNDFLSLEKLEKGIHTIDKTFIKLDGLIDELSDEMTLKKGQSINYTSSDLSIHTDKHILKNILINLISNASKYSGESDEVRIETSSDEESVIISVIDRGIGIPKEEQKNIFERFFRAGNATNIQGTGLGLNIVKKYADLIESQIIFESEENQGSTFSVAIPSN
ncbi:MAG: ATP-binding protein [Ekhidna sp.]